MLEFLVGTAATIMMIGGGLLPVFFLQRNDALNTYALDTHYDEKVFSYRKMKFGYGIYLKKTFKMPLSSDTIRHDFVTWVISEEQVGPKIAQLMDAAEKKKKMVDVEVFHVGISPTEVVRYFPREKNAQDR